MSNRLTYGMGLVLAIMVGCAIGAAGLIAYIFGGGWGPF